MNNSVLLVTPTPTHPPTAGNRARILRLINAMQSLNLDVHILHVEKEKGDLQAMKLAWPGRFHHVNYTMRPRNESSASRWIRRIRSLVTIDARYTRGIDDWYDPAIEPKIIELNKKYKFNVVIVEYVFLSRVFDIFDKSVIKILDTHDRFANRHRMFLERKQRPVWFSTSVKEERKGFQRADVALAIQEKEADTFRNEYYCDVVTVGHILDLNDVYNRHQGSETNRTLLFFGSDNAPNVDGVAHFLEYIFPLVQEKVSGLRILLAGKICDAIPDRDGCEKLGLIDDPITAYSMASMVINPVSYGTGLNIKVIEALGYGLPVVTTRKGVIGLPGLEGEFCAIADTDEQFAKQITRLIDNSDYRHHLANEAFKFAQKWNIEQISALSDAISGRT